MASRSIKPDPATHPHQIGDYMRLGTSKAMPLPHGLAASMKQGSATAKASGKPKEIGARMRQGSK